MTTSATLEEMWDVAMRLLDQAVTNLEINGNPSKSVAQIEVLSDLLVEARIPDERLLLFAGDLNTLANNAMEKGYQAVALVLRELENMFLERVSEVRGASVPGQLPLPV